MLRGLRELLLVLFVFLFNALFPAISNLLRPNAQQELGQFYWQIVAVIAFEILFTVGVLYMINRIDKREQEKDDARIRRIITEVFEHRNKKVKLK